MRRIATPLEIVICGILSLLGLSMLIEGSVSTSSSEGIVLIFGALCFTVGVLILIPAVRSIIWHRQMLRQSATDDGPALEHHDIRSSG